MTAQRGDVYSYNDNEYVLVVKTRGDDFSPQLYGLWPTPISTGCRRGYWCEYKITDGELILDKLYVNCHSGNYPPINGREVLRHNGGQLRKYYGYSVYNDLNLKIKYTGKLVVGKGFNFRYARRTGRQVGYAYDEPIEFAFRDGKVVEVTDHSEMARKVREYIESKRDLKDEYSLIFNCYDKLVNELLTEKEKQKYWWL